MPLAAITPVHADARVHPDAEHRRSFFTVRWLLIILASYLTVFAEDPAGAGGFHFVLASAALFTLSNLAFMVVPARYFPLKSCQLAIAITDVVFVWLTLYWIRVPEHYLHVAFMLVFLLAVIWRDIRVVLFSLFAVSVLYGAFRSFGLALFAFDPDIERFLTLSLFFIVAVFYLFLSDRLKQDALLTSIVSEERRRAEVMLEITRSISSSLQTHEILYLIVTRLCELFEARQCSIVRLDPKTRTAFVMIKAWEP